MKVATIVFESKDMNGNKVVVVDKFRTNQYDVYQDNQVLCVDAYLDGDCREKVLRVSPFCRWVASFEDE